MCSAVLTVQPATPVKEKLAEPTIVSPELAPVPSMGKQDQLGTSNHFDMADGAAMRRHTFAFTSPSGFVRPLDLHTCYTPWPVFRDVTDGRQNITNQTSIPG